MDEKDYVYWRTFGSQETKRQQSWMMTGCDCPQNVDAFGPHRIPAALLLFYLSSVRPNESLYFFLPCLKQIKVLLE